ncbi:hypothetical protein SCH4B_0209 [Ruegeria sp. TrichCH4B]|nr:hypothetical protein SCH4B_0209 [Ruegeria sp. TrichCH4B]
MRPGSGISAINKADLLSFDADGGTWRCCTKQLTARVPLSPDKLILGPR